MDHDLDVFLSIAQIAGIFVGFGALIRFSRDRASEARARLRFVVTVGLVVLAAALLPVGLARYGLTDRALWGWSSGGFLLVVWIAILGLLRDPEYRAMLKTDAKAAPVLFTVSVVVLEGPIQLPLILVVLGVAPALAPAFYMTALVLNLFEAALVLARLVFSRDPDPVPGN